MSTAISPPGKKPMTAEEFLELPDDGVSRELILGQIRERGMSVHDRFHSKVTTKIARALDEWLDRQPEPRGEILAGDAGFRLRGTRDSLIGADLAFVSAVMMASTETDQLIYDGAPILAVEILSPSDTQRDIAEKVRLYLSAGTVVWEVSPDFRRVSVHRPGQASRTFAGEDELTTEPELPGFRALVSQFFGFSGRT